jgi:hypothetical protein
VTDFVDNTLANVIGTFVGAALALLSTWWLRRRATKARERRILQGVLDRLYRSRAIRPGRCRPEGALTPTERVDFERCARSIVDTRDRIAAVGDEIEMYAGVTPVLDAMYAHCLDYLDASETDHTRYVTELMELRSALEIDARDLARIVPLLQARSFGTARPTGSA